MTDDKSVDTSVDEEALDTEAEDALENDETSFDDEGSDETEEQFDDDEQANESDDEEESEADTDSEVQDKKTEEVDTPSEEDRKRHNAEMAQKRIAEKKAKEEEKRKSQMEYVNAANDVYEKAKERGLSDDEARYEANKDLAFRQLQVDAYNNRIETNTSKLDTGIDRAVADIDLFRTGSQSVRDELAASLDEFEAMYIVRDQNGDPVEVKGDVYQFLQAKADSIRRLLDDGKRSSVKDRTNARSRTDTLPDRKPKEAKKDDMLDGFDEEAGRW